MYKIETGWRPTRCTNDSKKKKVIIAYARKLKAGQSFFVPKTDATTSAMNVWLRDSKLRTKNVYIVASTIKAPIAGTRLYRRL